MRALGSFLCLLGRLLCYVAAIPCVILIAIGAGVGVLLMKAEERLRFWGMNLAFKPIVLKVPPLTPEEEAEIRENVRRAWTGALISPEHAEQQRIGGR